MYGVMTRVALQPDCQDACAALFRDTNPALVANEPDWLGARMMFDPEANAVTVLATWRTAEAYQRFASSVGFRETMQKFAVFFAGPPEVSVHALLVDMTPDAL